MLADSGRKAAIGPQLKTCVGGVPVKVGVKGRIVGSKIKKPSDLFVGDDCAALQGGWNFDVGTLSDQLKQVCVICNYILFTLPADITLEQSLNVFFLNQK